MNSSWFWDAYPTSVLWRWKWQQDRKHCHICQMPMAHSGKTRSPGSLFACFLLSAINSKDLDPLQHMGACIYSFSEHVEPLPYMGKFLDQDPANFFYKGPDSNYFRLCGLHMVSVTCSSVFSIPFLYFKNPVKINPSLGGHAKTINCEQ